MPAVLGGPRRPMLTLTRYESRYKGTWDAFVSAAKNGVFLFYRDYMEYHGDRFVDQSILVHDGETPLAIIPGIVRDDAYVSHGGLTFGGVLSDRRMRMSTMLELLERLSEYLLQHGIRTVVYKAIPHIYHRVPAEEDLYALTRLGARLVRRDVSSAVLMSERLPWSKGRRWALKQARARGLAVRQSADFERFMAIEAAVLGSKYGLRPVHSAAEISLLASRFPENIKLFAAYRDDQMLGGVIVYESSQVAHAQYISATDEGKAVGALDLILDYLLNEYYAEKRCFDFGISTENDGRYLNEGLIANKEGFGARAVVYDFYQLDLA